MTIKDDWIAFRRLGSLLAAETAVAHAAEQLADSVASEALRRDAETAASSARRATDVLGALVPRSRRRRRPKYVLAAALGVLAGVSEGLAAVALRGALVVQRQRLRWALELLAPTARRAIVERVLPQRATAIASLADDGGVSDNFESTG
ncbi:MAG: hypothetical protein RIF41_30860 [Polyangiaceae bacterium]